MIQLGDVTLAPDDPLLWALAAGLAVVVVMVAVTWRAARQTAAMAQHLRYLAEGQAQLRGGLQTVSDTHAHGQALTIETMDARIAALNQQMNDRLAENAARSARALSDMQERMQASLHGSATQTTASLTQLQERLVTIDKAQDTITRLSGDVLGLQDILSNKQTRGAFGEIQLHDILAKALPRDAYGWQVTLGNGKRADCLVHLPLPPGPIVIDSKFPLEAYEALRAARSDAETRAARQAMRVAVRKHIRDIAEKYIVEGETADGALMFVPSEAVYAEMHGGFPDLVREGFAARVWIVSPTTCMATLNTMRAILKDARMRAQADAIRKALRLLHRDVELIVARTAKLNLHVGQMRGDLEGLGAAAERAGRRAARIDEVDFEDDPGSP
ncbi:MAG: DNA recombination protein RmuC [Rhodobacteraceae bacterium]|nr:DNA recombination protein RmuC [Paracoccaceae bacterium]